MTKLNVIGVDLAKTVIQVSVVSPSNRELRNSALSRRKFAEFLARNDPAWSPLRPVPHHITGLESRSGTAMK